jgi:branched-chain amino acid transport system substrate-binding protein
MKTLKLAAIALAAGLAVTSAARAEDLLIATAGPMTGANAAFGAQLKLGAEKAVADINAAGGVNGVMLKLEVGDDACDPKQAVAVANQLVAKGIKFVAGHFCSGSSIPASAIYKDEGVLQITPASTNPKFTDEGGWNVHRVCGRDDAQGQVAGAFLATKYKDKPIAILDDKSPYGQGLAVETEKNFAAAGGKAAVRESYTAGEKDFSALVSKLKAANVEAVYIGGYHADIGLIRRQMSEQGVKAQIVSGDSMNTAEFWAITGDTGEGTIFTFAPEPRNFPEAKAVVDAFKADGKDPEGYTLYAYAAVQMFAEAAKANKTTDSKKLAEWLRAGNAVKTVLGELALDAKGDIKNAKYVWYNWSKGNYAETMTP